MYTLENTAHESYDFMDTTASEEALVGMLYILACSDHQNYGLRAQACL